MLADGCQPGKKKLPVNSWLTLYFEVVTSTEKGFESLHSPEVCSRFSIFSIMIYTYEIA